MEASLPDSNGSLGSSPYAAPRELEHPLTPLASLSVSKLAWVQPRLMHPAYELWAGERVVATLRFRDLKRREALGASAENLWTIRDDPRKDVLFSIYSGRETTGACHRGTLGNAALVLRSGRSFTWVRRALREQLFSFVDERGRDVMQFRAGTATSSRTKVEISDAGASSEHASLLAIVGKYLLLANRLNIILRE